MAITTTTPVAEEPLFADVFATLAPRQQVWLALRVTLDTDTEANTELVVSPQMASRWKSDAAFRFCYDRMAKPNANRERDLVAAIERSNAVRAAVEKQRMIMKPWADCSPGEMRAKATLIEDTLERVTPKRQRIEHHATRSMKELITRGTGAATDETPPSYVEENDAADQEGSEDQESDGEDLR